MKFGIIVFPGSNCDHDCFHAATRVMGHDAVFIWHKESTVGTIDCIIVPGGFSYGDYLRSGAMAAQAPIMKAVAKFAHDGGAVLGICNGFQILQEAGLLPGALMRNASLTFVCRDVHVRVENNDTIFTNRCDPQEVLCIPIAHMDGNFYADTHELSALARNGQILMRYCSNTGEVVPTSNPNGSLESIAAVTSERGNVCGMMPHPERCAEELLGNRDGIKIFESIIKAVTRNT